MQIMNRTDFDEMRKTDKYMVRRWGYLGKVAEIVVDEKPETVLELGTYRRPIALGCDTMGLADGTFDGLTYVHDATVTPWPIEDKVYDMFIGLQVFEHLDTDPKNYEATSRQKEAFAEVMRISRSAILSFPFEWNCPGNHHHNITREKIKEWTLGVEPVRTILDENKIPTQLGIKNLSRIIYFWKFEDDSKMGNEGRDIDANV